MPVQKSRKTPSTRGMRRAHDRLRLVVTQQRCEDQFAPDHAGSVHRVQCGQPQHGVTLGRDLALQQRRVLPERLVSQRAQCGGAVVG